MSVKIVCPHCDKEFDDWEPYANHILEKHPADKERCAWAKRALVADSEPLPEESNPEAPQEVPQPEAVSPPHEQSCSYVWNKEKGKWLDATGKEPEATKGTYPRTKWSTVIGLGCLWIATGILASLYFELDTVSQNYAWMWFAAMLFLVPLALAMTVFTVARWKELS